MNGELVETGTPEASKRPLIVGHRANSIRKLYRYLSAGVDVIEFDVAYDEALGDLAVYHVIEEKELTRSIRRSYVRQVLSLREIFYILDYYWRRLNRRTRLSEMLSVLDSGVGIMIDLKTRGTADMLLEILKSRKLRGEVYVSSKYHKDLRRVKVEMPEVKTLVTLREQPVNIASYIERAEADGASIDFAFADEDLVREMHSKGYKVAVWTVNDPSVARYIASIGVDMIITDKPLTIMKALKDPKTESGPS